LLEATITLSGAVIVKSITQGVDFRFVADGFIGEDHSTNSRRASLKKARSKNLPKRSERGTGRPWGLAKDCPEMAANPETGNGW